MSSHSSTTNQRRRLGVSKKHVKPVKEKLVRKNPPQNCKSPPEPKRHKDDPSSTCHSPIDYQPTTSTACPVLSPSPSGFASFSFDFDINELAMDSMDKMDCGILSSTPLGKGSGQKFATKREQRSRLTSVPQYSISTPIRSGTNQTNSLYSNRGPVTPLTNTTQTISILQTPQHKANLSLTQWGLPEKVLQLYSTKGVTHMFQWQADCLSMDGVLTGRNIIYSAPTSAGKTLIAELLLLKCILEKHKKVIMILPFVSIVHEKMNYLQDMFEPVGIKVGGFMGGQVPLGGLAAIDIAICTIEKANSLINRVLEEDSVDQLGMVIVDELHMVGDHHRGYLLELLLTKLLYVSKEKSGAIQLLGMSATLPNLSTLAKWLNAVLYQTDYRPVPLQEMIKIGDTLYDYNFNVVDKLTTGKMATEDEEIAAICCERIANGHSILIFCPTKAWCEKLATTLAQSHSVQGAIIDRTGLDSVCEQLRRTTVGIDPVLLKTLPNAIAFHHGGLTFDERDIIEGGFRQCHIRVLVATSTLSSGVNLPARLVIVRTPIFYQNMIDIFTYKQMIGRAGRKGVDNKGESILVCKPSEKAKVTSLVNCTLRPVQSCLGRSPQLSKCVTRSSVITKESDLSALKRAVLEVIANGTVSLESDILQYLECTLLYTELSETDKKIEDITSHTCTLLRRTLEFLREKDFIRERDSKEQNDTKTKEYYSTQFGIATVTSGLSPDNALIVFEEFRKARKAFVLENELHIIYLVTPMYILDQWPAIDWYKFYTMWERLSDDVMNVARVIGVQESFLAKATQSKPPERTQQQIDRHRMHRRFYASLVLQELVREVPIGHVCSKYGTSKGLLQSLQAASGTFSGMVTAFCSKLGWTNLELLLSQFQNRLTFGIERELIDLVKISLLNGRRARVLFNGGYHNLASIATANPIEIEKSLRNAFPYKTKNNDNQLVVNWCSKLRKGMTESEAANEIVQQAKRLLCEELNIPESALETYKIVKTAEHVEIADRNQLIQLNRKANNSGKENGPESNSAKLQKLDPKQIIIEDGSSPIHDDIHDKIISDSEGLPANEGLIASEGLPASEGLIASEVLIASQIQPNNDSHCSVNISHNTGVRSNISIDPFMDFSFNTFAQLDVLCGKEEVVNQQDQPQCFKPHTDINDPLEDKSLQIIDKTDSMMIGDISLKELSILFSTTCSESGLTVIDVSASELLLETFLEECREQDVIAFSVAKEIVQANNGIGAAIIKKCHSLKGLPLPMSNEQVLGVAFSWGEMDTYYLSLCEPIDEPSKKRGFDISQIGASSVVALEDRIKCLQLLFEADNPKYHFVAYDVKKHVKLLMSSCKIDIRCQSHDPKVADWLLDPDTREKTLNHMILKYLPTEPKMADGIETTLCTVTSNSPFAYLQAAAECVLADMLMESLNKLLKEEALFNAFEKVEMPVALILAKMEVNGIGFSTMECEKLRDQLQHHLSDLEQEAYKHAGRIFTLTSPEDVSIVLFNELKLPTCQNERVTRTIGGKRGNRQRIQHFSTSKDILEKIRSFHPLPGVVLEWRRVSGTVSRTLFPLFKASVSHSSLQSNRIHSSCQIHTATGRVSFSDPNLQNVPKEYPIGLHMVSDTTHQSVLNSLMAEFETCAFEEIPDINDIKTVCMRNVFKSFPEGVFIGADYAQLELRLLAHLSKDVKLCCFLNQSGDAFRMIAGEWLSTDASNISDKQRQQTKQMCYGILYGIGAKALAEQMGVTDNEAYQFMDSFKSKYPQLRKFITTTINECRDKGYIVTMMGRKRFLPNINSTDLNKRSQAERQAVNSTIQGSAADLVKLAMIKVENELKQSGIITCISKLGSITRPTANGSITRPTTNVALLVLQLHDELLYEVHVTVVTKVAQILKNEMENALKLSVAFPVKIKTGTSWGQLEPYN